MISIYALCCPLTGCIMYIGQSKQPRRRLSEHLVLKDGTRKANWVQGLRANGHRPEMLLLEDCADETAADEAELWWVRSLSAAGAILFNMYEKYRQPSRYQRRRRPALYV